jgi:hypothetical protein
MVKPRPDQKTITIVDEYCSVYRDLFPPSEKLRVFQIPAYRSAIGD